MEDATKQPPDPTLTAEAIAMTPVPAEIPAALCGCGSPHPGAELKPGMVYCDGRHQIRAVTERQSEHLGFCPTWVEKRVRARISAEVDMLAGEIGIIVEGLKAMNPKWAPRAKGVIPVDGGFIGFEDFDGARHESALRAYSATMLFAVSKRKPEGKLLLVGGTGQGKTLLLLLIHFHRLVQGIDSRFVTTSMLRRLFRDAENFDAEIADEARSKLWLLKQAAQICADDLGNVAGDQRTRGTFAEGLKDLLSSSRAAWAVTTNLTSAQASEHADLGWQNVSRMLGSATVVKMDGPDARVASAVSK